MSTESPPQTRQAAAVAAAQGAAAAPGPGRARRSWRDWFAGGFFLLAVLCSVYGIWFILAEYRALATRGEPAEATVVALDRVSRKGSAEYRVIFRYRTAEGEELESHMSSLVSSPDIYPLGQRVAVLYDPERPSRVRPAEDVAEGPGVIPWVLGAFALLFGWAAKLALSPRRRA